MRAADPYARLRQPGMGTKPPRSEDPATVGNPPHPVLIAEDEKYDQLFRLMLSQHEYVKRMHRAAFDFSNPVDEYQFIGQALNDNPVNIIPDYGSTEIYETIVYSLPIGTTSAVLRIGSQRNIQLYNGAATTVQQIQVIQGLVLVAVANDERILTLAGAGTTDGYINLMGHAFDREGLS